MQHLAKVLAIVTGLVLLLPLAGCNGGGEEGTSTPTVLTATATATPAPTAAKKKPVNPLKTAERSIAKAVKLASEGQGTEAQKALFTKGLKGLERLLQTIDPIADPDNPPAPDSAWGRVIALSEGQNKIANLLAPGPQDAF